MHFVKKKSARGNSASDFLINSCVARYMLVFQGVCCLIIPKGIIMLHLFLLAIYESALPNLMMGQMRWRRNIREKCFLPNTGVFLQRCVFDIFPANLLVWFQPRKYR